MSTNSLLTAAQGFAQTVANTPTQKARLDLCIAKRMQLFTDIKTVAGVRRYLTVYRAEIKKRADIAKKAALLNSLRISKPANDKLHKAYKTKIIRRTENADHTPISADKLPDLLAHALELLNSGIRYKVATGLMLLTGRRTAEIFLTGHFAPVQNNSNKAVFSGQIKRKDKDANSYQIPLLAKYKTISAAHTWLQNQYDGKTAPNVPTKPNQKFAPTPAFKDIADVNKCVAANLGRTVKSEFGAYLGADVTPHDLRKAYVAICHYQLKTKDTFRETAEKILGHSGDASGLVSETYTKYKVQ